MIHAGRGANNIPVEHLNLKPAMPGHSATLCLNSIVFSKRQRNYAQLLGSKLCCGATQMSRPYCKKGQAYLFCAKMCWRKAWGSRLRRLQTRVNIHLWACISTWQKRQGFKPWFGICIRTIKNQCSSNGLFRHWTIHWLCCQDWLIISATNTFQVKGSQPNGKQAQPLPYSNYI